MLERGRHGGRDEEERLWRGCGLSICGGLTELSIFCKNTIYICPFKRRANRAKVSFYSSPKLHPAPPTFHPLILALLFFVFALFPFPPPPPATLALSLRNWVKLLEKQAYEKSGIKVTSSAIYDESAVPPYRSVRARHARQSTNKSCLLVLAAGILRLVVMDLAVVNNDGDHIHFQPDVVD